MHKMRLHADAAHRTVSLPAVRVAGNWTFSRTRRQRKWSLRYAAAGRFPTAAAGNERRISAAGRICRSARRISAKRLPTPGREFPAGRNERRFPAAKRFRTAGRNECRFPASESFGPLRRRNAWKRCDARPNGRNAGWGSTGRSCSGANGRNAGRFDAERRDAWQYHEPDGQRFPAAERFWQCDGGKSVHERPDERKLPASWIWRCSAGNGKRLPAAGRKL